MFVHYLIRVGSFGTLFRCQGHDGNQYDRGQRVVCRTPRGIELGWVTATVSAEGEPEGSLVRRTTVEDELLIDRLERYRTKAVIRCQQLLADAGHQASLIEVDPLLDGRTLVFYFLGTIDAAVQRLTDQLAAEYERSVRSKHFAKLLAEGCGPGCGTEEKSGGGCSGGCAVCVAAAACGRSES